MHLLSVVFSLKITEQHHTSVVPNMNLSTHNVHNNWTTETAQEDGYDNEEIVRKIQVIGRPPIIVLGTIGNILTFLTMQRGSLKNTSTCFYMAILALADTGNINFMYPAKNTRIPQLDNSKFVVQYEPLVSMHVETRGILSQWPNIKQ